MQLTLELDQLPYTVHRLPTTTPASAYLPLISGQHWFSVTKTSEEISLVISHDFTEADPKVVEQGHEFMNGWRCFKVAGPLDFSLVGILANLSNALAEHKISLFVVSTYDTDYILVKKDKVLDAQAVFEGIGHTIKQV